MPHFILHVYKKVMPTMYVLPHSSVMLNNNERSSTENSVEVPILVRSVYLRTDSLIHAEIPALEWLEVLR